MLTELGLNSLPLRDTVHQISLHACSKLRALKLDCLHAKQLPELPPQLEELYISAETWCIDNRPLLTSISSLKALSGLRVLEIVDARKVDDLTPIEACTALESLSLVGCERIQMWPDFRALGALTKLDIWRDNDLASLDLLSPLSSLRELDLQCDHLGSLQGIEGCTLLSKLNIGPCRLLRSIESLQSCPQLSELHIFSCSQISTLEGLRSCPVLSELCLTRCPSITSLDGLQGCPQLTELNIERCGSFQSLEGLQGCPQLTELNIEWCGSLQSLEGLHGCPLLTKLSISGCRLASLLPLRACALLKSLSISCSTILSLDGLHGCSKLVDLDMSGCSSLSSLEPLVGLSELSRVYITRKHHSLLGMSELRARGVRVVSR